MPFEIIDTTTYICAFFISTVVLLSYCFTTVCIQIAVSDLFANMVACYRDLQEMFTDVERVHRENAAMEKDKPTEPIEYLKEVIKYHRAVFM